MPSQIFTMLPHGLTDSILLVEKIITKIFEKKKLHILNFGICNLQHYFSLQAMFILNWLAKSSIYI